MYPRNAASPPRIAIGAVVQISDGAVQSSGVSVVVRPEGGSETAGGGTVSYGGSSSVVYYVPTQAETNYTAFVLTAYKSGCIPVSQTIVTSESATAGRAYVGTIATDAITADAVKADAATEIAAAVEAAILNEGDATALLAAIGAKVETFLINEGDATATLAAIATAVWAAATRTVTGTVTLADGSLTAAKIASDAITAAKVASDAVTEIQNGLATAAAVAAIDKLLKADLVVDKNTTPWQLVAKEAGTATELWRKDILDVDGGDIVDTDTIVGGLLA